MKDHSVCPEPTYKKVYDDYSEELRNYLYYRCGDLQQAEDIAIDEGEVLFLEEIYELKSRLYETWEDYPKAFLYMKKYLAIKDSLFNQTTVAESVSLENQSELSKQERMIDDLEKNSEEQQLQYPFLIYILT